jgi:hypothetical protein
MKIPKLKFGDRIEVIGTDWNTDHSWRQQGKILDSIIQPTIYMIGYFVGIRDNSLFWSAVKISWDDELPEVKYTHSMPLASINEITKLRP